jgi:hypothetical protein
MLGQNIPKTGTIPNNTSIPTINLIRIVQGLRDGFRESIIRCGVKIDNGLEKPNQGLKKAEKVKNSDQTSGSNLRARYTLTTARGAR